MRKRVAVIALILLAAALATWWWMTQDHRTQQDHIVLYGNVDIRQVQLAFKTSERVVHMYAREGQRVQRGELLADLESVRAEQTLQRAEAQMAAKQQQLAELEAGSRSEEIERLQAELQASQAEAHNAQLTANRLTDLVKRKLASQEQVDNARAALDAARGRARAAAAALKLAQSGPRPEQIAQARANLRAAQADVELARQTVADSRLLAPVDGIIRDRITEPGDMAAPGKPIYTIALTDPVWVRTYVAETDLGKMRPGEQVQVQTDSFPDKRYAAWIGYISPTAEFTPKAVETTELRSDLVYQMRVYVCNPDDELRLGMPATVMVPRTAPGAREAAPSPCAPG